MSNHTNYFCNVMPFGLKNAGATYKWLMEEISSKKIEHDLEVYIDDKIVKTSKGGRH